MVWCVTGKGRAASFTILVSFFTFLPPLDMIMVFWVSVGTVHLPKMTSSC